MRLIRGLMGMAMDDSNVEVFTSRRWLAVLKHRLIQSRTEVQGCFPGRFLMDGEDLFSLFVFFFFFMINLICVL